MSALENRLVSQASEHLATLQALANIDPKSRHYLRSLEQHWINAEPVSFLYGKMEEAHTCAKALVDLALDDEGIQDETALARLQAIRQGLAAVSWKNVGGIKDC